MDKARELRKSRNEKRAKYVARNLTFDNSEGIRPCFVKALDSGEMCHQQRLALLQEAYTIGFRHPESIIDIFRCLNDFDDSITRYQVNGFSPTKLKKTM